MIRPITTLKPPPPPRVDPKANAEQITRLQAEATKLRNEIRLANKMGESDAAASARQRLTQVNAELTTAQSTAPATQPGPVLPTVGAVTPQGNGGTTTFPTLFTTQNFGGSSPKLVLAGYTPPDEGDPSPEITKAKDIVKDIDGGKSINNIAEERGMTPEQVVAALNAGGMTATATEYANGDTRQVVITDGSGRTITENQDFHHGGYYTEVTGPDGQATSSPIRDDLGRKETTSVDPKTGAITTKFEDDLGDGSVTERTTNPQTRITTTTETNGEGVVTVTKNLPNGSTVKTVTPNNSVALPVTTVTGPDGKEVTLAQTQTSDGSGAPSIQDQLAEGKSIEEIAEERGLTPEQVIAELNAAGLEVTQGGDPGETLQIVVTDPDTGKTVTYNNDYHHGTTSVTVTEGNTETTDSVDGNGVTTHTERNTETGEQTTKIVDPKNNTETTIVFDKDGRRTETIVEKLGDGEPIEYEVKPGDNLSDIAEAYGVTLEELAESNPELFTSPRDPDLIHPGETVVIEGATKTTVNVTFNGYTLTTAPDGKITLTNDTTGAVTDIAVGTAQEALAGLLLDINPNSSDPEKAKEDRILKATLDSIFGGATPELTAEVLEKQQAVVAAMKDYGPAQDATGATLDGGPTSVGPYGNPPSPAAPSGGKWVPLLVDGSWKWFDPVVAKAIAAENVAIANLGEAQAKSGRSAAQLDVYALDPEYKNAMEGAESTLDDVLAPYGLDWKPPEPKGTLADAQNRLTLANNALESATTARTEYEAGEQSLLDAIDKQVDLPAISDPNQPAYRSSDGPSAEEENQTAKAAHAEVAELFTNVSLHTANGNKATIDQLVASTELELKLTDAKPGSPEYTEIDNRLTGLKGLQGPAANQVTLAEAYQEYGVAQSEAADLAVTMEPLKQQLLAQAQERNPHHFDWEGYTNGRGEFTGKIKSQDIVEENGQLYVVTVYENETFTDENGDDTNVHKSALTYALNDEGIREDFRNDPLNKQWQEMLASTQQTSSSAPVCTQYGTGSQSALAAAKSKIVGVQVDQLDAGLKDAKTALVDATAARDQAITDYGPGTVEAPAGTLKPGEQAVKITVNGRDLWVAPEVAAAYEQQGPSAIGDSGKWVQIEMDGQKLWVHPEVAAAEIDRGQAETDKEKLEEWEEDVRPAMVAARDWYSFYASHPKLLELGAAQHEAELKNEYFDEHRKQAMASYQVQFDGLYEAGFTGEYKGYTSGELSGTVAQTLGLDPSSEGVEKVVDEITDRAGDNPEVKLVPIFSLDGGMESSTALFAIKSGGDEIGYVDSAGKYYSSFDEFQHENRIFSEKGNLVMAKGGDMSLGKDGFSADELEVADARKVDFWDKATDIGLGIVAGVSTVISFVPGGQWAIPIAIGSGSLLGGKALYREGDHLLQGGDFDSQSAWNITMGVTSFLPAGAGALRTFGLARSGLSTSKAFAGGFGMTRMKDASWGIGRFQVNLQKASYADDVSTFIQSGNKLTTVAWGLDAGAVVTGVPLLGKSVEDLAAHGGEMSLLELANAVMGIGVGAVGTGLGGRSLLYNMPGASGARSGNGTHPSGSFPGGPDSGPQPRAVYEVGPDGVYRPTGKHVMPDPNEVVIDGDVIGETSGQQGTGFGTRNGFDNTAGTNRPNGPRALPAGDPSGPNQPPPTGGRFDPSGDGQSSRPMVVHEQGSDGVYRPTDKLVFHDSSHPVVEGTVINVHDDGAAAPGERGDAESAKDSSADGARELNARQPADSDPIVVPTAGRDAGATSGNDNSGFGRLTWDPVTKSFTGLPEANTADYIYTSGKDPSTPSVYLDGVRPGDPMVKFTPEELLARYEQESRYYSGREMAERYGPNGLKLPERSLQKMLPDIRVTGTFRLRVNTGAFGIGSPTTHAVAFGLGTKTDFGHLGWSVVDSISQKSTIPLRDAASSELMFTGRFREYLNVTGLQAGLSPFSHQTIFPVRGTKLLGMGENAIFKDAPGYTVKPRGARITGQTPDGKGAVVDLTYSLNLDASPVKLAEGQRDFFGVTADNKAGFVRLEGPLPYDRVMAETKITPRVAVLANIPVVDRVVPRIGFEKRPEMGLKDTPGAGDVVSRQFFDLNQSMFDRVKLKVQFVINDANAAADFVAGVKNKDVDNIAAIREMMTKGQIEVLNSDGNVDRATLVSYVPNPLRSGLRLSAVAGKPASTEITLLTGEKRRVTHPDQSYLDLQLNDATSLPGVLAFNPDRFTTSLSYRLKSQLQKVLPERFQTRPPQARQMPTDGNVYRNFYGPGGDNPSTRYTVYFGTPHLRLGPIALSAEVRIQYKTKAAPIAPSVASKETATLLFDHGDRTDTLAIPAWLARTVETAGNGSSAAIPKGGKASLESFLGELQKQARPDQAAAIEQFRNDFGTVIADGKFLRADAAEGVLAFLATQARGDGPVTPRNAAPRQSPEEQGVKNTSSHVSSSTKPLTEAEIVANRQEASRLLEEMVPQDIGMPEMTLADLADQFSRSPTLMSLLRGAHAKGVRIVNPARQDLRIFDTSMEHDLTATGSHYDGPLKVISVDADMFRSPGAERGHDVVTGEFVDALAHELSHVTDPSSLPAPKDFQDRQAFVDAFVGANLNNEGRARFIQYAVAGELSANGGKPAPVLSAESNSADSAVYARYEAGEINRSQAIDEMSSLFRDKEPSTVPGGTYQDFYTQQAEAMPLMSNLGNTRLPGKPGPANSGQPDPKNQPAPSPGINLTRNQLQAITGNRVGQIDVSAFNAKQVPWLTRKQMAKLTTKQLQDLNETGLHIYLTKPQIRAIPDTKIQYLNVAGLDAKQIPWLTDKHIENLTEQQFIDLNEAGLQARFIKAQLQAVPDTRIELLDVKGLEGKQIPWLTRKQIAAMSDKQFQELGDAGLLKYLTKAQLPEAGIKALDVAKLDSKQVPWLTGDQVAALTREQWGAFTIHHIEALTRPQFEAATPKQFAELSPGQFRKFTLEQFEWMSMDQRNALSVLQLTTFRATHKKAMTPDQKAAVNEALSHARKRENAQAIATFGGMSSTSLALWSALPPHWSATASAVAFGARGVVFGTQALFPNATANHKPFGRFLNGLAGATFVAAAPGAAVGLVGGKDLIVNSSFTLGNIVYGTKSMLQSMTGRPVIRNIAEHLAGPGYVLGCAVYTVSSWPSPIATTAGTLFTFGCAEFWASAIRTDRLNRRSVPRTDEDIAKAEKSDARWTKADRWSLGITFGIGMLLFSLDSLLGEPWKPASDPAGSDPVKPGDDASDDDATTPPDDTPDTPPEKETPPEEFPQLVVVAGDGLNLREKPTLDSEGIVVLEPGTFVEQTGKPSTETSGRVWIPIEGYGPDGEKETGWVAADFVKPHPEGASNPDGRTNPKLEESGYEWVEVRDGDSIRLIASTRSADVAETVVLNMDHILSPDVIFAGDRIYLPVTATG